MFTLLKMSRAFFDISSRHLQVAVTKNHRDLMQGASVTNQSCCCGVTKVVNPKVFNQSLLRCSSKGITGRSAMRLARLVREYPNVVSLVPQLPRNLLASALIACRTFRAVGALAEAN